MKSLFLALSAVALFSSAAVAGDVVRQTNVAFGDLNLASKDGAVALHNRLLAAASDVCADTKETTQAPYFEECRKAAVNKAIAEVGYKVAKRLATVQ